MTGKATDWPAEVHRLFTTAGIGIVGYVPDAGHKKLIELCIADKSIREVPLTTEEEALGLATGAWLGGMRCAVLMQSSGVGNIINVLGTIRECRIPLTMIITMRGQYGEFNPWQVPMGQATPGVLQAMDVVVESAETAEEVAPAVDAALRLAYNSYVATAVLVSQRVIGIKSFQEQVNQ